MGRYVLTEKLGEGGMGTVFRARDMELDRLVAVKIIAMAMNGETLLRFQREMKLLSKLSHPNIIRVFDSGELDGRPFFAMELVEGQDIERLRRDRGALPFARVSALLAQAADALAEIHAADLVHRDVKPANMLLERDRLVLMDFGLARDTTSTVLTEPGCTVGTPRFLAPEVWSGDDPSGALDVWALGICAHELLTGVPVHDGRSMNETIHAIVDDPPPDLGAACPGLPVWFLELHARSLAKKPADRPTAAEYRETLRNHGASSAVRTPERPPSRPPRTRAPPAPSPAPRPGHTRHGVALALTLAAVGAVVFTLARPPAPPARAPEAYTPPPAPASASASRTASLSATSAARPVSVRIGNLVCRPTDDAVMIDFDLSAPRAVAVSLHPRGDAPLVPRVRSEGTARWFHHVFTSLRPRTEYLLKVTDPGGWPLLKGYPFTTRGNEHREAVDLLVGQLESTWRNGIIDLDLLRDQPSPRTIPVIARVLKSAPPADLADETKFLWCIDELRSRELADLVQEVFAREKDPAAAGELTLAVFSGRPPALLGRIREVFENAPTMKSRRFLSHALADVGGADACDQFARWLDRDWGWSDDNTPYLLVRTDPGRALAHARRWLAPGPRQRRLVEIALQALETRGDEAAAQLLEEVLAGPDADRGALAARALARFPGAARRSELAAALEARPDDAGVYWSAALAGVPAAAPRLTERLAARHPWRRRAHAAYALGQLESLPPPSLAALRDALDDASPEVAAAAAWALGQQADEASCGALLALAISPRDRHGAAALALGRLRYRGAATRLLRAFDALRVTSPAAGEELGLRVRQAALAWALGEVDATAALPSLRALADQRELPRGARDVVQAAERHLRRAARGGDEPERFVVVPQVPVQRTGIVLAPGDAIELAGAGVWGFTNAPLGSCAADVTQDDKQKNSLGLTGTVGVVSARLGRAFRPWYATQPTTVVLSAYAKPPVEATLPLELVSGFAIVTVRRPK